MDFTKMKCSVCSEHFKEDDDVVVCPKCGAPYHRECYDLKGKCIFPDLHKSGKSWQKEKSASPETSDTYDSYDSDDDDQIVCRHCGHKNSRYSIVCENCGDFLTFPKRKNPKMSGFSDDEDDENDEDDGSFSFSTSNLFSDGRMDIKGIESLLIGVKKDDDFDGVSGEELMTFVGKNELYYGPVFSSIKHRDISRINFASMFFFGIWHIFRKQYLKGVLLSLIYFLPFVTDQIFSRFLGAAELWKNAKESLSATNTYVDYQMYLDWIMKNCDFTQGLIMLLPSILNILTIVLAVVLCFRSNRSYYKFCLKKIKEIKAENPDAAKEDLLNVLSEKGGTNFGLAFMVLACEIILAATLLMV